MKTQGFFWTFRSDKSWTCFLGGGNVQFCFKDLGSKVESMDRLFVRGNVLSPSTRKFSEYILQWRNRLVYKGKSPYKTFTRGTISTLCSFEFSLHSSNLSIIFDTIGHFRQGSVSLLSNPNYPYYVQGTFLPVPPRTYIWNDETTFPSIWHRFQSQKTLTLSYLSQTDSDTLLT